MVTAELTALPATLQDLANSPHLMEELRETAQALTRHLRAHPEALGRYSQAPMDAFLAHARPDIANLYPAELRQRLDQIVLASPQFGQRLAAVQKAQLRSGTLNDQLLSATLGDGWGTFWCEVGYWSAIVAAIGGLIAISQGALLAPLIALQDGIVMVALAAITGLSETTVGTVAAVGGFTLEKLIAMACGG